MLVQNAHYLHYFQLNQLSCFSVKKYLTLNITYFLIVTGKRPGPAVVSPYHFIKFSFKDGIDSAFYKAFSDAVANKAWEHQTPITSAVNSSPSTTSKPIALINSKIRSGIVGIERSIEEQHRATDESISVAFKDLTKLMEKAKDMVAISKNISNRIRVNILLMCVLICFSDQYNHVPLSQ